MKLCQKHKSARWYLNFTFAICNFSWRGPLILQSFFFSGISKLPKKKKKNVLKFPKTLKKLTFLFRREEVFKVMKDKKSNQSCFNNVAGISWWISSPGTTVAYFHMGCWEASCLGIWGSTKGNKWALERLRSALAVGTVRKPGPAQPSPPRRWITPWGWVQFSNGKSKWRPKAGCQEASPSTHPPKRPQLSRRRAHLLYQYSLFLFQSLFLSLSLPSLFHFVENVKPH